jgi:hypothetical protein
MNSLPAKLVTDDSASPLDPGIHAFFTTSRGQLAKTFCEGRVDIGRLSLRRLRGAIQKNEVSFPSQIPTFACQSRSDIQWRLVDLYFVRGWTCSRVAERYGMTMERARQIISNWVQRAVSLGYLQQVPPLPAISFPLRDGVSLMPEAPGLVLSARWGEQLAQTAGASNRT